MVVVFAISCPSFFAMVVVVVTGTNYVSFKQNKRVCWSGRTGMNALREPPAGRVAWQDRQKECWTYSFSLENTPLALQLWALWLLWMHAATCLSARESTNKEVASAALFLATAVGWRSSKFFCTYLGQKPEMPRSFFFLQCAGALWGPVTFCGCWDGRPLFCHRTSCAMGEGLWVVCKMQVLHNSVQWLEARILPGPCLFRGSGVFWWVLWSWGGF